MRGEDDSEETQRIDAPLISRRWTRAIRGAKKAHAKDVPDLLLHSYQADPDRRTVMGRDQKGAHRCARLSA